MKRREKYKKPEKLIPLLAGKPLPNLRLGCFLRARQGGRGGEKLRKKSYPEGVGYRVRGCSDSQRKGDPISSILLLQVTLSNPAMELKPDYKVSRGLGSRD